MKLPLLIFAIFLLFATANAETISFPIKTDAPENKELQFALRIPSSPMPNSRIMILFGGRNWQPDKTIKSYNFDKLADRHSLFLLSPGFKNDDYWQSEKWSGKALLDAVKYVREKYHLPDRKLFYYGYSAGDSAQIFLRMESRTRRSVGRSCLRCLV
jgi:poly(3-hydroxybutyrate) depolymerase